MFQEHFGVCCYWKRINSVMVRFIAWFLVWRIIRVSPWANPIKLDLCIPCRPRSNCLKPFLYNTHGSAKIKHAAAHSDNMWHNTCACIEETYFCIVYFMHFIIVFLPKRPRNKETGCEESSWEFLFTHTVLSTPRTNTNAIITREANKFASLYNSLCKRGQTHTVEETRIPDMAHSLGVVYPSYSSCSNPQHAHISPCSFEIYTHKLNYSSDLIKIWVNKSNLTESLLSILMHLMHIISTLHPENILLIFVIIFYLFCA